MIQVLPFIAVAAGLLFLLLFLMRRSSVAAEGSAGGLVAAKRTLRSLQAGLLPADLIDRVFGKQDVEYVASLGSIELNDLLIAERKRLALVWVRQIRQQIHNLKEFHTRQSRMYAGMSRVTELSVALNFAELQFQCRILELLLRWRGPYAAPGLVRSTAITAGGLCSIFDKSLAFLTPPISDGLSVETDAGSAQV